MWWGQKDKDMIKHRSLPKEKFILHLREHPNSKLNPSPTRGTCCPTCFLAPVPVCADKPRGAEGRGAEGSATQSTPCAAHRLLFSTQSRYKNKRFGGKSAPTRAAAASTAPSHPPAPCGAAARGGAARGPSPTPQAGHPERAELSPRRFSPALPAPARGARRLRASPCRARREAPPPPKKKSWVCREGGWPSPLFQP